MSDVQVLYAEEISGTVTAATTAWVDVCSIPAASFTAGKKYTILTNIVTKHASAGNEARVRLVHGTTPTVFDDASLAYEGLNGTQEHENSCLYFFTQPGTTEIVKLQVSSSSTTVVTVIFGQIVALNLDDLGTEGTDYFSNEFLGDYTMTASPTAKAITASFTPDGTDRWLFVGHMIWDAVSINTPIGFELYDSVAGVLNSMQQEAEDATLDFLGANLFWVGVPTNAARTLAVRPFNSGSSIMLASRVIAINLAKFAKSASAFNAAGQDPATTPTYSTLGTVAPTPSATGNWVVIAFSNVDANETTTDLETRLQIDADGGGLVSKPAYPTTPTSIDNWDATDIVPFNVFNLVSLTSGAGDINWDWRRVAGTTGRVTNNGLVAFSVALADASTPKADNDSATESETGSLEVTAPVTDAGTESEAAALEAVATATDAAALSEGTPDIAQAVSDAVTESETAALEVSAIPTDAAVLGEATDITASATATDAGAESETAALAASATPTDAAALSETAQAEAQATGSDAFTLGDTGSVQQSGGDQSLEAQDAFALAGTAALAASATQTDALALGDAAALAADLAGVDAAALSEGTPDVAQAVSDAATEGETAALAASTTITDALAFAEATQTEAQASGADTATLTDLGTVAGEGEIIGQDAFALTESAVVTVSVSVTEAFAFTETTVEISLALTDAFAISETFLIGVLAGAGDAFSLLDLAVKTVIHIVPPLDADVIGGGGGVSVVSSGQTNVEVLT